MRKNTGYAEYVPVKTAFLFPRPSLSRNCLILLGKIHVLFLIMKIKPDQFEIPVEKVTEYLLAKKKE